MTKTKKDNLFITFLQGFVIGFGIIFPISSSVLAMTMGIYERLLKVINNLFTSFKEEKGFLISFILGVVASAIVCCLILNITLNKLIKTIKTDDDYNNRNITLTNEEFQKYQYQPKKLAYDLYGSTEYYYMILFINSMTNIKEFNRRRINLMRAKDMSNVLSAIYSSESEYIERTQQLISEIENENEG